MGLFDTLRIEMKIPGFTEVPDVEFQTKSFDSAMENYVISNSGELYREVWDYKWVDDNEVPIIKGYMQRIEGSYRREYLTDFHGDIIFYTSKPMSESRIWRDYTARFTTGRLTRIWYEDKQY
jgi:hypothetical protein